MYLSFLTSPRRNSAKTALNVLIEREEDGSFSATVIGLPDCKTQGATREEALIKLHELLTARKAEVVSVKIEPAAAENPWMKFAGMFEDDPQFEQMLEYIEVYRRELDAETEAYYRQLDAEDETK